MVVGPIGAIYLFSLMQGFVLLALLVAGGYLAVALFVKGDLRRKALQAAVIVFLLFLLIALIVFAGLR